MWFCAFDKSFEGWSYPRIDADRELRFSIGPALFLWRPKKIRDEMVAAHAAFGQVGPLHSKLSTVHSPFLDGITAGILRVVP